VLSPTEEFLDDYGRHEYEYPAATKLLGIGSSSHYDLPIMVPAVDGLTMNNSSTLGSQAAPERDIYDQMGMGIMSSAPLSQQLQQECLQEKQLLQKQPQQQTPEQQHQIEP
jgi:NADP-dependent 3-hydroxy acid dehydrogenase YdfG